MLRGFTTETFDLCRFPHLSPNPACFSCLLAVAPTTLPGIGLQSCPPRFHHFCQARGLQATLQTSLQTDLWLLCPSQIYSQTCSQHPGQCQALQLRVFGWGSLLKEHHGFSNFAWVCVNLHLICISTDIASDGHLKVREALGWIGVP